MNYAFISLIQVYELQASWYHRIPIGFDSSTSSLLWWFLLKADVPQDVDIPISYESTDKFGKVHTSPIHIFQIFSAIIDELFSRLGTSGSRKHLPRHDRHKGCHYKQYPSFHFRRCKWPKSFDMPYKFGFRISWICQCREWGRLCFSCLEVTLLWLNRQVLMPTWIQ